MEETCSSETPVDFQRTTRRYTPEDHNYRGVNLKSCISQFILHSNVPVPLSPCTADAVQKVPYINLCFI
jgi:hypothetical protein